MSSPFARVLAVFLVIAPLRAGAVITFVTDPAAFQADASVLGFEALTPGSTATTATPDSFTVDFDGTGGGFPVVAYGDLSASLAAAASTAGLGSTALRIDNGANQEIRFDPPVTRIGMFFSSSGSLLTDVTTFLNGVQTVLPTQVSGAANTIQFLGFKDPDGIDRLTFSGDSVDSEPVLIDGLVFQRRAPVLYHFRGTVTSVTDGGGLLGGDVAVGSPFTVSALVTPEADDFNALPALAQYSQPSNLPFTLSLGGRTYTTTEFELQVQNDNPNVDGFVLLRDGSPTTVASPGLDPSVASIRVFGFLGTANTGTLTDTSIPDATPDVGLFETSFATVDGFPSGGGDPLFSVQGQLLDQGPLLAVINTEDSGLGSLRQAILDANARPGADTIVFDIPADRCSDNGVCQIALQSDLPPITEAVTIDATTQPRFGTAPANVCATPGTPSYMRVEVVDSLGESVFEITPGSSAPVVVRGFSLVGGGSDVHVAGAGAHRIQCNHLHVTGPGDELFFPGFTGGIGVQIDASAQGAIVGTDGDGVGDVGERNVIAGAQDGIYVNANDDNRIAGNFFCLAADGTTSLGGATGILIRQSSSNNLVGTDWDGVSDALEANVAVSCETGIALGVTGGGSTANVIAGNRLGLAGTGNGVGLDVQDAPSTVVGDNVFTANTTAIQVGGVSTFLPGSERNCIVGNAAGLVQSGSEALEFEKNWWGDASGPSGDGPGTGDSVSVTGAGSVDFTPFATDGCFPVPEPDAAALAAGAMLGLVGLARRKARPS